MTPPVIYNVYGVTMEEIHTGKSQPLVFSMIPHFFYEFNNDPTVIVINSGLCTGPTGTNSLNIPVESLRKYLTEKVKEDTKVCFDNLYEGNITPIIHKIYSAIEGTHILPSQCYFFSGALDSIKLHNEFCENNNIKSRINVMSCNTWEYSLRKESKLTSNTYKVKVKDKLLVCFNRILRPHRLALVALLNDANLLEKCYYSFFIDATYDGSSASLSAFLTRFKQNVTEETFSKVIENLKKLMPSLPLKLNIDWTENANYVKADDLDFFENSYLSLVTETYFFPTVKQDQQPDDQSIFFSEKVYKPILMRHPFILACRPGALATLRQMGYKTFSTYIDETYDTIENDNDRLNAIVIEITRLSKFTDEQWITWQTGVQDIVEHNYRILMNREKHMYVHSRNSNETQY